MPELTERQKTALAERIDEAKAHDVEISPYEPWSSSWHVRWEPEFRPGRGQDFNAVWCDGENLVQISLDPYGSGYMSIGSVDWIHGGEDCTCDVCEAERKAGGDE